MPPVTFRQTLNETGYIEGKNVAVEFRWGAGEYDRLPLLAEDLVSQIIRRAREISDYQLTINLELGTLSDDQGFTTGFQIEKSTRNRLLNGLDDIGLTLQAETDIAAHEARHPVPAASSQLI